MLTNAQTRQKIDTFPLPPRACMYGPPQKYFLEFSQNVCDTIKINLGRSLE